MGPERHAGRGGRLRRIAIAAAIVAAAMGTAPAVAGAADDTYDGSQMWLRYVPVTDAGVLAQYRANVTGVIVENADHAKAYRQTPNLRMETGATETLAESSLEAARDELVRGAGGLLGHSVPVRSAAPDDVPDGVVVIGTRESSPIVRAALPAADLAALGDEGYALRTISAGTRHYTVIAGNTDLAALYGTFAFLRLMQTQRPVASLGVQSSPRIKHRQLNYWDTERLYAGNNAAGTGGLNGENGAVFDFAATGASAAKNLPVILNRYVVVARALASLGINGITINNVNANNAYLTPAYIAQEAALADALRPYGIRLALSIQYTAPTDARFAPDTLTTAQLDPTGAAFRGWWTRKAQQLQASIPDFLGFTVKANSEGQPGPQDSGHDHGDGANAIGAAVAPLGMKVFWRTFVYNADVDHDRLKRAYLEFGSIDDEVQPDGSRGRIADNVFLQTKNGPLDFQGREPVHPMFGRMENTNQALELQITQEYTGQNKMLTYLGPEWEEILKTDTHATNAPADKRLVGNIVDGSAQGQADSAIVGVANLGNADNLTGHHFAQANLFAWGRMAWDWTVSSRDVARDWVRMTWSNDAPVVDTITQMMMGSWPALVAYQTPLGIGHQFRGSDHYGPMPSEWTTRDDWSPVYYNQADSAGLGFDRSPTGSNLAAQYFPTLQERYSNIDTTPEDLLMWFHHVPWDRRMSSGRPFWDELVYRYQLGVEYVTWMRETWDGLQPSLDARRFAEVKAKLATHETDAGSWRDTSVSYWREFSGRPIPVDGGPLSARITVAGKEVGSFNLSDAAYSVPVAVGASPTITAVRTADPMARAQIVSQATSVPGQAVVKVTGDAPFGPVVKNYVLNLVPDTTLRSLRVNGAPLASFRPDVLTYDAVFNAGADAIPTVRADASDPAATVLVEQAATSTGQAKVTVTSGGASTVYTVDLDTRNAGSDEFGSLGPQWQVLRPDPSRLRVADGALVITAQNGDLQGAANTAKNVVLQDVDGDWTADSKLVFSRPLANNNEQGGIIAYNSDQNYVKLAWEMSSTTQAINRLRVVVIREQNGTAATLQVTGADAQQIVGADGAIWLRLAKLGSTYKAYYSSDGRVYRYMGTTTLNVEATKAGMVAFNRGGTATDLDVAFDHFRIASTGDPVPALATETPGDIGGSVPAVLALTLGPAGALGPFTPGLARDYTATLPATVISTALDARLSVADPSATATGRLVNGTYALSQPLQVNANGGAFAPLGASASPTALLTYDRPVSNDPVTIGFKQPITATEGLRTGTYAKTLTFTLAATMP